MIADIAPDLDLGVTSITIEWCESDDELRVCPCGCAAVLFDPPLRCRIPGDPLPPEVICRFRRNQWRVR